MENKQTGFAFFVALLLFLSLAAIFAGVLSYGERQKVLPAIESQTGSEEAVDLPLDAAGAEADSSALPVEEQE